jgi:uncharacterized membrane protein YgcG
LEPILLILLGAVALFVLVYLLVKFHLFELVFRVLIAILSIVLGRGGGGLGGGSSGGGGSNSDF